VAFALLAALALVGAVLTGALLRPPRPQTAAAQPGAADTPLQPVELEQAEAEAA
jgi:hypothetical protein